MFSSLGHDGISPDNCILNHSNFVLGFRQPLGMDCANRQPLTSSRGYLNHHPYLRPGGNKPLGL
jgi:hypothetical protein